MERKSDYELMQLVAKRHRAALEELYERYSKLIYSFVFKFTRGNEEKTKEIIQAVFLRLWTTKSTYHPSKGEFVSWLLSITRNICIDDIRKANRERIHTEFDRVDSEQTELADPDNHIEKKINSIEIREAKKKLTHAQKKLIDLLYWRGYSLREISQMENEPIGTIKNRLHQSLKQLRKNLEQERGL